MLKNLIYVFIANFINLASKALIFIIIARLWRVDEFGIFMYCFVIVWFVQVIIDYGFNLQLVKEGAEKVRNLVEVFSDCISVKHFLTFMVVVLSLVTMAFVGIEKFTWSLYFLLLLSVILSSYNQFFLFPFNALSKFSIVSIVTLINNLIFFVIVLLAVWLFHAKVLGTAFAFVIARFIAFLINLLLLKKENIQFKLVQFKIKNFYSIFKTSLPYGVLALMATAYLQADTFFIKYFLNNYEVGIYQAGMRLLLASMFIGTVVNTVYLPFCSNNKQNILRISEIQKKIVRYLAALGMIAFIIMSFFSRELIALIYSAKYFDLIKLFPLFGFIIVMRYFGSTYGLMLTVFDLQKLRAFLVLGAFILNLILNYYLVPKYHLYGALIAAVVVLIYLNTAYIIYTKKVIHNTFLSWRLGGIFLLAVAVLLRFYVFSNISLAYFPYIVTILFLLISLKRSDITFFIEEGKKLCLRKV